MIKLKYLVTICLIMLVGGALYVYSGAYPMGADVPHNAVTYRLLEYMREQSVAAASEDIKVPPLDDVELLLMGGPDYNDMCSSCHLKPGLAQSDMSIGLYPVPPNLSLSAEAHGGESHGDHGDAAQAARRQFWIIKHGIKASGMPAWGPTHDDQRIWSMVAFLQKLPSLTPEQYQILTARGEADEGGQH